MDDDSHVIDKGWDALPDYAKSGDGDDAVTLSISTTPGEWLVNTMDSVVVPMSMADVVDALRARQLTERSLVWRAGMQEWAPIDKVPQLKLAARMPATLAPSQSAAPPKAASSAPPPSTASMGRPSSKSPPPRPTPAPQAQPSRRSTLPFGLANPAAAGGSRPSQPKPSSPPPPPSEEPEVLAVYARPAATISFDLSPSEPARVPPPAAVPPPQTLAPTTSDTQSRPRSAPPPPYSADLSVVAASQFRAVQRTSKRLVWVSSVGSAAAASVLTLWLSGVAPWARPAPAKARAPEAGVAVAAAVAPAVVPLVTAAPPVTPSATPAPAPSAAPAAAAAAEVATPVAAATPKPAARKARAAAPAAVAARPSEPKGSAPRQPSAEPNPYDVKLDEEPASKPPARGLLDMMQESETKAAAPKEPEASAASGSAAPGF